MLAGKGFANIYNLSGGIKAFEGPTAIGAPDLGLALFKGSETGEQALLVAFGLETGLQEFYTAQEAAADHPEVKAMFQKLGSIEVKHQERIVTEYNRLTGRAASREELEAQSAGPDLEGGLTTEEYMKIFNPDLESVIDIVSIALSIEGQALDLYMRAADRSRDEEGRRMLNQMAAEEKTHMTLLGDLLDEVIAA